MLKTFSFSFYTMYYLFTIEPELVFEESYSLERCLYVLENRIFGDIKAKLIYDLPNFIYLPNKYGLDVDFMADASNLIMERGVKSSYNDISHIKQILQSYTSGYYIIDDMICGGEEFVVGFYKLEDTSLYKILINHLRTKTIDEILKTI